MKNSIERLKEEGQVVWLDFLSRELITSGELAQLVKRRLVTGVTSNPSIFRDAITGSSDYATSLRALAGRSLTPYEAYLEIAGEIIRRAADILRGVYDATGGRDGFVSFEAQAGSTSSMVAEARTMFALVDRPT